MITNEYTIEVNRPVEEVFAYVDDLENFPRWYDGVAECKPNEPGERAAGTGFFAKIKQGSGRMEGEILTREPSERLVLRLRDEWFEIRLDFRFSPSESGTRIDHVKETSIGNPSFQAMAPQIKSATEQQIPKDFARLKADLERAR